MIDLHIFTNSTQYAPNVDTLLRTFNSFTDTFGKPNTVSVWCDSKPNIKASQAYKTNLEDAGFSVTLTTCMADGYKKAVSSSQSKYMFMLEHDWVFLDKNIHHNLEELTEMMEINDLFHLRFNKRNTDEFAWDTNLEDTTSNYCLTDSVSNNPHIIHRERYIERALRYVEVPPLGERGGIEQPLTAVEDLRGAIYGKMGHPQTVQHTDARNRLGKFR